MDFFHKYEEYRTLILDFYAELVYYNVSKMSPAAAENPLCGFFHEINSLCEFFLAAKLLLEAGDILLTLYC